MKDRHGNEWVMVPREASESALIAGLNSCDPLGALINWDDSQGDCATRETVGDIYKAMLAAASNFGAVDVTDEVAQAVFLAKSPEFRPSSGKISEAMVLCGRDMIAAVRAELGPALGMVEIREPTDDECADIHQEWLSAHGIQGYGAVQNGRAMFEAVRHVMWSKA